MPTPTNPPPSSSATPDHDATGGDTATPPPDQPPTANTAAGTAVTTPQTAGTQARVDRVRLFGTRVWLAYRPDLREWQRRREHGLAAVRRLDVLDVLMDLPAGLPVPWRSLTADERQLLARLPPGVVDRTPDTVTRHWVPALTPLLAIVPVATWPRAAAQASRFAVHCPRMVLFGRAPADGEVDLFEASLYGIGVAVGSLHSHTVLLAPEPDTDWQPTPAGWAFSETIYRQVCEQHAQTGEER